MQREASSNAPRHDIFLCLRVVLASALAVMLNKILGHWETKSTLELLLSKTMEGNYDDETPCWSSRRISGRHDCLRNQRRRLREGATAQSGNTIVSLLAARLVWIGRLGRLDGERWRRLVNRRWCQFREVVRGGRQPPASSEILTGTLRYIWSISSRVWGPRGRARGVNISGWESLPDPDPKP